MHTADLDGRYTIDEIGRVYTNRSDLWLPSVSTVIDVRDTPEQLQRWKERTDNYKEIQSYKQNFGTLAHEQCLSELVPTDPATGDPIERLWGKDEEESVWELKRVDKLERSREELQWLASTWETIALVANFDTVIDVETLVCNTDVGYAGQFDLLYHDEHADETVLADIKTSKAVYEKHLLQLVAYRMAVPMSIDRMEVIRMNPEKQDWELFDDSQWDADPADLETEFIRLRGELEQQGLKTIIETAKNVEGDVDGVMYEPM